MAMSMLGTIIECCEVKEKNNVLYVECMMPHHYAHGLLIIRNSRSVRIEIGDFAQWDSVEGLFYWTPIDVRNVHFEQHYEHGTVSRFTPVKSMKRKYKRGTDFDIKIKLMASMNVTIERKENQRKAK